jgi:hypothetical protein
MADNIMTELLVCAALAAAVAMPLVAAAFGAAKFVGGGYRFRLRSLMIAMTIVAVMLGIIMWMARGG